jgi:hypothetical protein
MPFFNSFFLSRKPVLGPSTVHTQASLSPLTTSSWETTQPARAK